MRRHHPEQSDGRLLYAGPDQHVWPAAQPGELHQALQEAAELHVAHDSHHD